MDLGATVEAVGAAHGAAEAAAVFLEDALVEEAEVGLEAPP